MKLLFLTEDDVRGLLTPEPVVERYRERNLRRCFRGDAAFALSDGHGGETISMTAGIGYDRHGFNDYLGNIGSKHAQGNPIESLVHTP